MQAHSNRCFLVCAKFRSGKKNLLGETFACQGFRILFPSSILILIRCEEHMKRAEEPPSETGLSYLYSFLTVC